MPTLVQSATGTDGGNFSYSTAALGSAQTAGNTNIVVVGLQVAAGSTTSISLSDNAGNSYGAAVAAGTVYSDGTNEWVVYVYVCSSIAASTGNYATTAVTTTSSYLGGRTALMEYTGSLSYDTSASADGGTGAPSVGPITTATASELLLWAVMFQGVDGGAPGGGWTVEESIATYPELWVADKTSGSAGSYSASGPSQSFAWSTVLAAFKSAGVSPPTLGWSSYPNRVAAAPAHRALREAGVTLSPLPITPNAALVAPARQSYPEAIRVRPMPAQLAGEAWLAPQAPAAPTSYPGRIAGRVVPAIYLLEHAAIAPAPERTAPLVDTDYPDRVVRPTLQVSAQPYGTEPAPTPERTSPLSASSYPERVLRARSQQYAPDLPPLPEVSAPSDWYTLYPERARGVPVVAQQRDTSDVAPLAPERTSPIVATWYPERIDRAALPTAQQLAWVDLPPYPLPNLAAPTVGYAWYPDVLRPVGGYRTSAQAFEAHPIEPIATAAAPYGGPTCYPDRFVRPTLPLSARQYTAIYPEPERTSPLVAADYPSRLPRPTLAAPGTAWWLSGQPAIPAVSTSYPGAVVRARAAEPGIAVVAALPSAPVVLNYYQDRVARPAPARRSDEALVSLVAPPPPAPTYFDDAFPAQVRRPQRAPNDGSWLSLPMALPPALQISPLVTAPSWMRVLTVPTVSVARVLTADMSNERVLVTDPSSPQGH